MCLLRAMPHEESSSKSASALQWASHQYKGIEKTMMHAFRDRWVHVVLMYCIVHVVLMYCIYRMLGMHYRLDAGFR